MIPTAVDIIEIPKVASLYSPVAQDFVDSLGAACAGDRRVIVLLQNEGRSDDSVEWIRWLRQTALREDLAASILRLRRNLREIDASRNVFVYVSNGDVLGSFWELAYTCDMRRLRSHSLAVGFPEVPLGAYPYGGALETGRNRDLRLKQVWGARPVLSAARAARLGMAQIDLSGGPIAEDAVTRWVATLQEADRSKTRHKETRAGGRGARPAPDHLTQLEKAYRSFPSQTLNAWEACWQLVRQNAEPSDALDDRFAFVGSSAMVRPNFANRVNWNRTLRTVAVRPSKNVPELLAIDLDGIVPPSSAIGRILTAGIRVVAHASSAERLASSLEILKLRLDRALGEDSDRVWASQVDWFVGGGSASLFPCRISWSDDSYVTLTEANQPPITAYNLDATASDGVLGWCEYAITGEGGADADLVNPLLFTVFAGICPVEAAPWGFPVSIAARLAFFSEFLRVSELAGEAPDSLLTMLGECGWGFAARRQNWDVFLDGCERDHRISSESLPQIPGCTPENLSQMMFPTETQARKSRGRVPGWNRVSVSRHMAVFMAYLQKYFAPYRLTRDPDTLVVLLRQALGVPDYVGESTDMVQAMGRERFVRYVEHFWGAAAVEIVL